MTLTSDPGFGARPQGRLRSILRSVAWGPAIGGVLSGIVLGSGYSLCNRLAAFPPVELAASTDERPATGTPANLPPTFIVKPADGFNLRDIRLQPIPSTTAASAEEFRSLSTLSVPSPRLEAEVRTMKGEPHPAALADDIVVGRSAEKVDAVAAVWGFLAVGLGGSTASAGTPHGTLKPPR